jgi:excisionase family DNA binding protein
MTKPLHGVAAITVASSDAIEPLLVDSPTAIRLLSVSPRLLWTMTNRGEIPHVRLGRRVLYPLDRLKAYVAAHTEGGAE